MQPKTKKVAEKVAVLKGGKSLLEIENEYVMDISRKPCTLSSLAEKYQIKKQVINEYSASNHWKEKRKKHIKITKQKSAEKIADRHRK